MALESTRRWQIIRDVIIQKKSGALVAQSGRNYLHWFVEHGNLMSVSSTFPEASLTRFIQEKNVLECSKFLMAQNKVDPSKTLGAILLKSHLLEEEQIRDLIVQHWINCNDYLFDSTIHLFWSAGAKGMKPDAVRCDRPIADVLMQITRSSISIPDSLRLVQDLHSPLRTTAKKPNPLTWNEQERRIWMYLQSGSTIEKVFQDPEIAKVPCYKFLFLLWVCGFMSDSRPITPKEVHKATTGLLDRIPAEWIFPLCAGTLIGVILAPSSPPKEPPPPAPNYHLETVEKPSWSAGEPKKQDESEQVEK
jgi:hypothetical protein